MEARYLTTNPHSSGFYILVGILGLLVALGLFSAYQMEHHGHWITGMSNRIVWGTPHVFAVFLIVAASGALNVASVASVFGNKIYKPLGRLSGLLALTLLAGGLAILVLDLGRPETLIIAMTEYNFKSIFAWNMILYNGFFIVVMIYLWMMFERRMNQFSRPSGALAFAWRIILTTGTGSIFGFLVARQAYDALILAPMFVAMSFAFGLAIFLLVLFASYLWSERPLGDWIVARLRRLLSIFVWVVLYFVAIYHIGNLYLAENAGVEHFLLVSGGIYTHLFWYGQILLGTVAPLFLLHYPPTKNHRPALGLAAALVIIGALAQLYVLIIGAQAYPLEIFPDKEILSGYGGVAPYTPSFFEIMLGVGGVALALFITAFAVRVLPFLPESLADEIIAPKTEDGSAAA